MDKLECPECKSKDAELESDESGVWSVMCDCGYESDSRLDREDALEQFEFELSEKQKEKG